MSKINKALSSQVKAAISKTLNSSLNESYVAEPKKFDLRTELLSEKTKKARQEDFEEFIKALNQTSALLDTADRESANDKASEFRRLKLDEVHNQNASFLRALHFENISDLNSKITMDMMCFLRLERDFGSFDNWQKDFIACCMSSRDGYAMTGYSLYLKRYINFIIDTESLNVPIGVIPVVVLDVAEGAYYRDYMSDRKSYVMGMMKEFDWERIEERFLKAEKIAKANRI
jgi:superoxide dismutase, Fe-Mn family